MTIEQMLAETGAVEAMARELNVDPATARAGAMALLPQLLQGFQQPAATTPALAGLGGGAGAGGGLGGLIGMLGGLGGGALLDKVTADAPTPVGTGNDILGQIFGSKDKSREVAADAAAQSGVEPSLLKKMLPILAMLVGGYMLKKATAPAAAPATGAGPAATTEPASPAAGGLLGELIGAAGGFLRR